MATGRQIDAISIGIGANLQGLRDSLRQAESMVAGYNFSARTIDVRVGEAKNARATVKRLHDFIGKERTITVSVKANVTAFGTRALQKQLRDLQAQDPLKLRVTADLRSAASIRKAIQDKINADGMAIKVPVELVIKYPKGTRREPGDEGPGTAYARPTGSRGPRGPRGGGGGPAPTPPSGPAPTPGAAPSGAAPRPGTPVAIRQLSKEEARAYRKEETPAKCPICGRRYSKVENTSGVHYCPGSPKEQADRRRAQAQKPTATPPPTATPAAPTTAPTPGAAPEPEPPKPVRTRRQTGLDTGARQLAKERKEAQALPEDTERQRRTKANKLARIEKDEADLNERRKEAAKQARAERRRTGVTVTKAPPAPKAEKPPEAPVIAPTPAPTAGHEVSTTIPPLVSKVVAQAEAAAAGEAPKPGTTDPRKALLDLLKGRGLGIRMQGGTVGVDVPTMTPAEIAAFAKQHLGMETIQGMPDKTGKLAPPTSADLLRHVFGKEYPPEWSGASFDLKGLSTKQFDVDAAFKLLATVAPETRPKKVGGKPRKPSAESQEALAGLRSRIADFRRTLTTASMTRQFHRNIREAAEKFAAITDPNKREEFAQAAWGNPEATDWTQGTGKGWVFRSIFPKSITRARGGRGGRKTSSGQDVALLTMLDAIDRKAMELFDPTIAGIAPGRYSGRPSKPRAKPTESVERELFLDPESEQAKAINEHLEALARGEIAPSEVMAGATLIVPGTPEHAALLKEIDERIAARKAAAKPKRIRRSRTKAKETAPKSTPTMTLGKGREAEVAAYAGTGMVPTTSAYGLVEAEPSPAVLPKTELADATREAQATRRRTRRAQKPPEGLAEGGIWSRGIGAKVATGKHRNIASENPYSWKKARKAQLRRQPFCSTCGIGLAEARTRGIKLSADKKFAQVLGGDPFDPANLDTLCVNCNSQKGHLPPLEERWEHPRPRVFEHPKLGTPARGEFMPGGKFFGAKTIRDMLKRRGDGGQQDLRPRPVAGRLWHFKIDGKPMKVFGTEDQVDEGLRSLISDGHKIEGFQREAGAGGPMGLPSHSANIRKRAEGGKTDHKVKAVFDPGQGKGRHFDEFGKRCLDHGHCGICSKPVIMNKAGQFKHKAEGGLLGRLAQQGDNRAQELLKQKQAQVPVGELKPRTPAWLDYTRKHGLAKDLTQRAEGGAEHGIPWSLYKKIAKPGQGLFVAHAEKRLDKAFPNAWSSLGDLPGLLLNDFAEQGEWFARRFPKTAGLLDSISPMLPETEEERPNAAATTFPTWGVGEGIKHRRSMIEYSPHNMALNVALGGAWQTGFHPDLAPGVRSSVLTHELGHSLHIAHGLELERPRGWLGISRYGMNNPREGFAEWFDALSPFSDLETTLQRAAMYRYPNGDTYPSAYMPSGAIPKRLDYLRQQSRQYRRLFDALSREEEGIGFRAEGGRQPWHLDRQMWRRRHQDERTREHQIDRRLNRMLDQLTAKDLDRGSLFWQQKTPRVFEPHAEGGVERHSGLEFSPSPKHVTLVGERGPEALVTGQNGQTQVVAHHNLSTFMGRMGYAAEGKNMRGRMRWMSGEGTPESRGSYTPGSLAMGAMKMGTASLAQASVVRVFVTNLPSGPTLTAHERRSHDYLAERVGKALSPTGAVGYGMAGAGQPTTTTGGAVETKDLVSALGIAMGSVLKATGIGKGGGGGGGGGLGPADVDIITKARAGSAEERWNRSMKMALRQAQVSGETMTAPARSLVTGTGQITAVAMGRAALVERQRVAQAMGGEAKKEQTYLDKLNERLDATRMKMAEIGKDDKGFEKLKNRAERLNTAIGIQTEVVDKADKKYAELQSQISSTGDKMRIYAGNAVGIIGTSVLFGTTLGAVSAGMQLVEKAVSPLIERYTGFYNVTNKIVGAMADQTRETKGNVEAVMAATAAHAGLSDSMTGELATAVRARTVNEAGAKAIAEQVDLIHTMVNLQNGSTGFFQPQGGIPGLTRSVGGAFGTPIGATPSLGEQLGNEANRGLNPDIFGVNGKGGLNGLADIARTFQPVLFAEAGANIAKTIVDTLSGSKGGEGGMRNPQADPFRLLVRSLDSDAKKINSSFELVNVAGKKNAKELLAASEASARAAGLSEDQAKSISARGYALTTTGGEAAGRGAFQQFLADAVRGSIQPTIQQLATQSAWGTKAQIGALAATRQAQISTFNPAQFGLGFLTNRPQAYGAGFEAQSQAIGLGGKGVPVIGESPIPNINTGGAMGMPSDVAASFDKYRTIATGAIDAVSQKAQEGQQALLKLGVPASLLASYQQLSDQVAGIQMGVSNEQARLRQMQYNQQLYITRRNIADTLALYKGQASALGQLGTLQRKQVMLERESTSLQLALSQRQINFQRAMAGFVAPGTTPEERAARIAEAKVEADYAQRQLDIQKQLFTTGIKIFDVTGERQLADLRYTLGEMQAARKVELDTSAAQQAITALQTQMGAIGQDISSYMAEGQGQISGIISQTADWVAQTGKDWNEVQKVASANWSSFVKSGAAAIEQLYYYAAGGGFTGSSGAGKPPARHASGILFDSTGPTDITVGEAGKETVAVLRNPRKMNLDSTPSGGGGGPLNFNFSFVLNGSSGDLDDEAKLQALAMRVAAIVETSLNRKTSLFGIRRV